MQGQHSSTKPATKSDIKLSMKHLKERVVFNKKHLKEHKQAPATKYNTDHAEHHSKQIKDDKKLIKDRQKMLKGAAKQLEKAYG